MRLSLSYLFVVCSFQISYFLSSLERTIVFKSVAVV